MNKKGKLISFRANEDDMNIIERTKQKESSGIRKVTDADVIRFGLSLIGNKKTIPTIPKEVNLGSMIMGEQKEFEITKIGFTPEVIPQDVVDAKMTASLSDEQLMQGYQYIQGDLCDKDGFPLDQSEPGLVIRNGEVYATEPKRAELKEIAAENSEKILSVQTPVGKMNVAMATILESSEKLGAIIKSEPGMLSEFDGVDEAPNEEVDGQFVE